MKSKWTKIKDDCVVTCWKPTCNCSLGKNTAEMFPCDIEVIGVPICGDCGTQFEYDCTKIKSK